MGNCCWWAATEHRGGPGAVTPAPVSNELLDWARLDFPGAKADAHLVRRGLP